MTHQQVPEINLAIIIDWIGRLTRCYGLYGINSLDFIVTPEHCYVLEINPRPSASMMLYDVNLFPQHIKACRGEIEKVEINKHLQAYQIIYAPRQFKIPMHMHWPEWSMDRPAANATINSGQPICSIIADGSNEEMLSQKLQTRATFITTTLEG